MTWMPIVRLGFSRSWLYHSSKRDFMTMLKGLGSRPNVKLYLSTDYHRNAHEL